MDVEIMNPEFMSLFILSQVEQKSYMYPWAIDPQHAKTE